MITSFRINNCFAFNKQVEMNLKADMRTKKFYSNVISINNNINILKSAVLYGPNNTGKTSFIDCLRAFKNTLQNKFKRLESNIFNENTICELGISFISENKEYKYDFSYDAQKNWYVYEKMCELSKDEYGNEKETLIFVKDIVNEPNIFDCPLDESLKNALSFASNDNILIYTIQADKFPILQKTKEILTKLASNIEIVDMNRVPIEKTIEILKNNDNQTKKIVSFIKNADLYLDDYKYSEKVRFKISNHEMEEELQNNQSLKDQFRLVSIYKGKAVPSLFFDSLGTKKVVALASYIITAIETGKTLIIDELDSSLHFKITRAIISMFNNELNINSQLIASLHDISLLDCKKMFRKEQIWFTSKDEEGADLYSLKEFTYAEDGIRDTSDIIEKYSKGVFGAVPEPDLISTLFEEETNEEVQ